MTQLVFVPPCISLWIKDHLVYYDIQGKKYSVPPEFVFVSRVTEDGGEQGVSDDELVFAGSPRRSTLKLKMRATIQNTNSKYACDLTLVISASQYDEHIIIQV
jgi:hypothetical protein